MSTSFSRSADSCLLGKCTAELPKVRIPEETHDKLQAKANSAGMSMVEYLRYKAMIDAHGFDMVSTLQQSRLKKIAGIGDE